MSMSNPDRDTLGTRGTPSANVRLPISSELYKGDELKRNPGIPNNRFEAFDLPSRVGDTLVYPRKLTSR